MYQLKVDVDKLNKLDNHAQKLKVKNSSGPLDNQTWCINGWPQPKLRQFGFYNHILMAKRTDFHFVCQI